MSNLPIAKESFIYIIIFSAVSVLHYIGQRFGLIKFGSCTEIVLPLNVEIKVKPGDKVKGSKTIIGVIN